MKFLILFVLFLPYFAVGDETLRNFAMPLAASAYSDNPNLCLSSIAKHYNNTPNFSIYRQYAVRCESLNDTCSGYIGINNADIPQIFIVFRGINNNYQFFEEDGWDYDEMVSFRAGGKVSKYFFDGFNALWNAGMKDDLLTLKNKYPPNTEYSFLGHSLGGAMASLAAATIQKLDDSLWTWLYTFGQPRTGNKKFAKAFDAMGIVTYRVIHKADIVPHLPPLNTSNNYYHHGNEWWYNNDMGIGEEYSGCDVGENPSCSDSLSSFNFNDHKYYYGREFIDYGINGCPDLGISKQFNNKNTGLRIPKKKLSKS